MRRALNAGVTPEELRNRTKQYAVDVTRFAQPLLGDFAARDPGAQLSRSAASAAANYRAACVARSHPEFRAKIGLALEECDESVYWLEFLRDAGLAQGEKLNRLLSEGRELARILGASKRTSQIRSRSSHRRRQATSPR
jgi:four helix bundle protein